MCDVVFWRGKEIMTVTELRAMCPNGIVPDPLYARQGQTLWERYCLCQVDLWATFKLNGVEAEADPGIGWRVKSEG